MTIHKKIILIAIILLFGLLNIQLQKRERHLSYDLVTYNVYNSINDTLFGQPKLVKKRITIDYGYREIYEGDSLYIILDSETQPGYGKDPSIHNYVTIANNKDTVHIQFIWLKGPKTNTEVYFFHPNGVKYYYELDER